MKTQQLPLLVRCIFRCERFRRQSFTVTVYAKLFNKEFIFKLGDGFIFFCLSVNDFSGSFYKAIYICDRLQKLLLLGCYGSRGHTIYVVVNDKALSIFKTMNSNYVMKINKVINKDIAIMDLVGNLTGHYALELQEYLNRCLDQTICFQLMNFRQTYQIDSLGIRAICTFIDRGGYVRLYNVEPQIKWRFEIEVGPKKIKIYNEVDTNSALSHFLKDISNKRNKIRKSLKYRHHMRISTNSQAICHFNTGNKLIFASSKLIDLSEGGFLVDNISLLQDKKVELITPSQFSDNNFAKISFRLSNTSSYIITDCSCARVIKGPSRLCIGGKFEQLSRENSNRIRDFIRRK